MIKRKIWLTIISLINFLFVFKKSVLASQYNPTGNCASNEITTSIGCIPVEANLFVGRLLEIIFGIAGGIAFLLMVYGFILVSMSGGDEKKVQGAKETITSAVTGLLICVFGLFILRLISVNILQIPGIN
jgi:hypothetical protein